MPKRATRRSLLASVAALATPVAIAACAPVGQAKGQGQQRASAVSAAAAEGPSGYATPVRTPEPEVQTYRAQATPRPRVDYMELPLRLIVPRLGVDAAVIAVGLTPQLAMDIPQRAEEIGWYEYSTRPGMKGNSILAGHLDWNGQPGVFRRLSDLRSGDSIAVRGSDGQERPYRVEWNREWPVINAPIGAIFEPLDQPALTLITCGGRWNAVTQRYDTRVVVRAFR